MTEEKKDFENSNVVLVGGKPAMSYVTAAVMQFTTHNHEEVILKSRGKFISTAVDVAEITCKRFLEGKAEIKGTKIDSCDFKNKEDKPIRVSTIEITLAKK